jgi:hypothetical protein
MSNPAFRDLADAAITETDRDLIAEVAKLIEETQAAVTRARGQIDETARLMSALLNVSAMFESVASRLVDATFKTSDLATGGAVSHASLLSLVEELGDVARQALTGAGSVRSELRTYSNHTLPTVVAFRNADRGLQDLSIALKRMALRQSRPARASIERASIEVEHRDPAAPRHVEKAMAGGVLASRWARSGGYKN